MAITKFIKDLFVVDVEEEVEPYKETRNNDKITKVTNIKSENTKPSRQKTDLSNRDKSQTNSKLIDVNKNDKKSNVAQSKTKQSPRKTTAKTETINRGEKKTMATNNQNTKVCLFEPRVFAETQDIADELKSKRAALVNLTKIDNVAKKRIVDFLSGTVYALEGDIQKVGADIFLCTPASFGVEGEISDKEEYFDDM